MSVTDQHHQSLDMLFSGRLISDTKTHCILMDLYRNWGVGLDSDVHFSDTAWNTFVG